MDYITQEEYLLALAEELKYLNPKDATKVLQYYQTRINTALDYGEKEANIIAGLPTPEEVAKETYELHGVNYLEIRKKTFKRKKIFNKIIDSILAIIILVAFFVVMGFILKSLFNMGILVYRLIIIEEGINKLISSLSVIGYILAIVMALIYVIDLFYILLSNFLNNIIELKDKDLQRKIFTFTITGLIEDKTKHNKLQLKLLISIVIVTLFLMVGSYANKGYLSSVLNNKPSNNIEVVIENNITDIKLDTAMANVYFKPSTNNQTYFIYEYELNNQLSSTIENNNLNINVDSGSTYDIFGLFNEPTPIITFFIPNDKLIDMQIELDSGAIDVSNAKLNQLIVNVSSKSNVSIVESNLNHASIKGFNVGFAIHKSTIESVVYEASKGQFIIEENAYINKLDVNNLQSTIKFIDSTINDLTLNNAGGKLELDNISGNILDFSARTSQNYLFKLKYNEMKFNINNTCSLNLNESIAGNINIESSNAFLIIDYIKADKMVITSSSTEIFLSNLGKNTNTETFYNNITKNMDLSITHNSASKTEITNSNFKLLSITQNKGYLICKDNYVTNGTLNLVGCNIVELVDLNGVKIELYLSQIETSITLDALVKNDLVYLVKDWDLISGANLVRNEETINFEVEGEE